MRHTSLILVVGVFVVALGLSWLPGATPQAPDEGVRIAGNVRVPAARLDRSVAAANSKIPTRLNSNRLLYVLDYNRRMPDTDVAQFDGVILQHTSTAERIAILKRVNPNIVVLYYRAAWGTWSWEENWPAINAHEDWFAHGADRVTRLSKAADANHRFYVMDLGSAEYRAYIINYITSMVNTRGFDGAFLDGPVPTLKDVWTTPAPTVEFHTAWHKNTVTFLRELKAALRSKLLITNSTKKGPDYLTRAGWPYPDTDWDDDDYLAAVDGTMIEGFAHAPWDAYTSIQGSALWNRQQTKFQRNIDAGKAVYVLPGTKGGMAADQRRWALFSYGAFLVRTDGRQSWFLWNYGDTAASHLFPELDVDLGIAVRESYFDGGVWKRDFTKGRVLVNAGESPRTADLGRPFRTVEGMSVTRVTLQPWTAMLLLE